jgi:putative transposase
MKKSKFTEQRTADRVRTSAGGGWNAGCRGVYRWKQLYGGLLPSEPSEVKKLRQLEEENARLRKVVADLPPRQGDVAGGDPPNAMTPARGAR